MTSGTKQLAAHFLLTAEELTLKSMSNINILSQPATWSWLPVLMEFHHHLWIKLHAVYRNMNRNLPGDGQTPSSVLCCTCLVATKFTLKPQRGLRSLLVNASVARCTCIRLSTLSWRALGGLFLGRIACTKTPSMNSWDATRTWKRWPQFFTQVSRTWKTNVTLSLLEGEQHYRGNRMGGLRDVTIHSYWQNENGVCAQSPMYSQ